MKIEFIITVIIWYLICLPLSLLGSLPPNLLEELQNEIANLVEITKPSVVSISSKSSISYTIPKENGLLSFFKENTEQKIISYKSICSGFIYNTEGFIISKSRFINENEEISIILHNGQSYDPLFIGSDANTGITILKIEANDLIPARLSNLETVSAGSFITIIGNSLGASPTLSFGIINGFMTNGLIQFSAIVCPGNSGSPIFNLKGELIGILAAQLEVEKNASINSQKLFTEAGIAFPINQANIIADQIIQSFREQIGWIGIQIKSDSLASGNIRLANVFKNSPAGKAGLKTNDILLKYNNVPLKSAEQLGTLIKKTKPGSTIPINFLRQDSRLNVFVTVEKRKPFFSNEASASNLGLERYYPQNIHSEQKDNEVLQLQNRVKQLEREVLELKSKMIIKHY